MVMQPGDARLLEARLQHMAMPALDHAGADRQTQRQGPRIVQAVLAIAHVTMSVAHRRFRFHGSDRLQMFLQGGDYLLDVSAPQALLLGTAPLIGLGRPTAWCRVAQILADVKEIAQKGGLFCEHLLTLNPDPLSPIAHRVDLAVQSPPSLPCTVPPALPSFGHTPEGGPVAGRGTALGLGRYQPHLLPLARPFALSGSRRYRANPRAGRFGNNVWGAQGGQHPKRLRVLGLQLRARPLRMGQ